MFTSNHINDARSNITTLIICGLIFAAIITTIQSIKFRTAIDRTYPTILLNYSKEEIQNTTLQIQGEYIKQLGEADILISNIILKDIPYTSDESHFIISEMHPVGRKGLKRCEINYKNMEDGYFGELYVDCDFEYAFIFPKEDRSLVYVAPAKTLEEAISLFQKFWMFGQEKTYKGNG